MLSTKSTLEEKLVTCQAAIRTAANNLDRLQYALSHYIQTQEKLSRKNVKMANALVIFAESEPVHLGSLLATTSGHLKELDTHREELTSRLEHLSSAPLRHYPATIGKLRADFRAREALVRQQHKAQATLEHHFMANDRARVGAAQVQLERVTAQLEAATTLTLSRVEAFELQKRLDVKSAISEMLWTEMHYHSKALQVLTRAHQQLDAAPLEADLEEIRERFEAATTVSKSGPSGRSASLLSLKSK